MNPNADTQFLGHRRHLLDEVSVVLPNLVLRVLAAMRKRTLENLAVPVALRAGAVLVELASGGTAHIGAAAGPDTVAHMSVSGVSNSGFA